jgi:hypothetical protein
MGRCYPIEFFTRDKPEELFTDSPPSGRDRAIFNCVYVSYPAQVCEPAPVILHISDCAASISKQLESLDCWE